MNAAAVKKPKASKPRKPIYMTVEKLVRPGTGEIVGALVPSTQWDIRAMRDRQYKTGATVRAELKKPRNTKFHRLAHAIGALAADHVEGFEGMETHDALKRLQRESGVCCEESTLDLGPLGIVTVKTPRSMAYDEMDAGEFEKLVHGICQYLREKYAGVPPSEIAEIIAAVEEGHS